jgi:hypothetical protein
MLNKATFNKVMKKIEFLKKQHDDDRKNKPNLLPMSWGNSLRNAIQLAIREQGEPCPKAKVESTMAYLLQKGIIVSYHGDYTFPGEPLPTIQQIHEEANKALEYLLGT